MLVGRCLASHRVPCLRPPQPLKFLKSGYCKFWQFDPQTIKDIAAVAQSKNIKICDAPVSGGTIGAQAGTLTFMVGADEQTFNELKPVL
ncbi:NAD(P)-binding domain-containing protein, partial [Acinetobacter baumannii]|uniref:NAD(P)-binding domain-containing protein n=1 Tax=Acinetobacter baumannii TaxID=470 RepID=UPI00390CD12D